MIELKIDISDLDYGALAELLLPYMTQQSGGADANSRLTGIIGLGAAKALLAKMPAEKKDELLARYVNKNTERINKLIGDAAEAKGIKITVSNVRARTV